MVNVFFSNFFKRKEDPETMESTTKKSACYDDLKWALSIIEELLEFIQKTGHYKNSNIVPIDCVAYRVDEIWKRMGIKKMPDKYVCPLSPDFRVACEIYHYNIHDKPANLTDLITGLSWCMDKVAVWSATDTLTDWMVIYGNYGPTGKGRAGYRYFINEDQKEKVGELYQKYWKDFRKEDTK